MLSKAEEGARNVHQRLESGRSNGLLSSELRDLLTKLEGVMEDLALGREMELSRRCELQKALSVAQNLEAESKSLQQLVQAERKRLDTCFSGTMDNQAPRTRNALDDPDALSRLEVILKGELMASRTAAQSRVSVARSLRNSLREQGKSSNKSPDTKAPRQ